jgi:glycolate oxidase iron-sulfur subunit
VSGTDWKLGDDRALIDYAKSLDCVHCGLCLTSCPTYALTGAEASSPRGRIHLMRAVAEGTLPADEDFAEEMDFCLLCRNCESVCPSGVRFGALMEHTRAGLVERGERPRLSRLMRWIGFRVILPHRFALRTTATVARLAQRSGLLTLIARIAPKRARSMLDAPTVPPASERARLPGTTPARGTQRGTVAVLEGCVMPELFGRVNRATVDVLAAAGYTSVVPLSHVCCGSLHAHNGDRRGALELARRTIEAFEGLTDAMGAPAPIVVNSAGCSAHLADLAHLFEDDPEWAARARALAARIADFSEFLARPEPLAGLKSAIERARERGPAPEHRRITWDDPCHLCHARGIRAQPRLLLDLVPGLERVEMRDAESCCGSAGIYALTRPDDAARVLEPKLASLAATGASLLVTGNPGCQLQWTTGVRRAGLDARVAHIAEVLADAVGDR